MLICPKCQEPLIINAKSAACKNHHLYDRAKEGYFNLLLRNSIHHGDNQRMVMARSDFLAKGYYQFLLDAITQSIPPVDSLCDIGCGQGYYTSQFKVGGFGLDISKEAIKIAAKYDKQHQYVIASGHQTPLADKSVDLVFCAFSPKFLDEFVRIGKRYVLLVDVASDHLLELRHLLFETVFEKKPATINHPQFKLLWQKPVLQMLHLQSEQCIEQLITMTPYTYRCQKQKIRQAIALGQLQTTASFILSFFEIIE